jgi:hypothetical protein
VSLIDNFLQAANVYSFVTDRTKIRFWMNLPVPYADHEYTLSTSAGIPNGGGLLFPFEENLAKDDSTTIPSLFGNVLFNLLGDDAAEAQAAYQILCSGWKVLKITMWGKLLTHAYTGVRLALETGAAIRIITQANGTYGGFLLSGAYFQVLVGDRLVDAQTFGTLQSDFESATPHINSLKKLFELIKFPSDMERVDARDKMTSLYSVSAVARSAGYDVSDRETMLRLARDLIFPQDRFLPINPSNVAKILTCMATGSGEELLPMHPQAFLTTDRNHRILSAFGALGPSFVFDGGRKMDLGGTSFSFKKMMKVKGKQMEVQVSSMYVVTKPWEKACNDLDKVLAEKAVWTIAGTTRAAQASSKSMQREFDGQNGVQVLAALRAAARVVVSSDPSASNEKKRKAEEQASAGVAKKVKQSFDDLD